MSMNAFYNRAVNLADSPVGGKIAGFTSKEGTIFRYNIRTNEFLTVHKSGNIQTMFRPERGMVYYLEQLAKYGN